MLYLSQWFALEEAEQDNCYSAAAVLLIIQYKAVMQGDS